MKEFIGVEILTVDSEKCTACERCIDECPRRLIAMGEDLIPKPIDEAEQWCIDCGHCVAICQTGALTHRETTPEKCLSIQKESLLEAEQIENLLLARRSIRTYKDTAVERAVLSKLIDIARYAPTGSNRQQIGWQVVYDRASVKRLAEITIDYFRQVVKTSPNDRRSSDIVALWDKGIDVITRGAPHLVLTHSETANAFGAGECALALSYFDLAAQSRGLGTCHIGYVMTAARLWPPMQDALSLPEGRSCFGAMTIGYPEYRYQRIPPRKAAQIDWR